MSQEPIILFSGVEILPNIDKQHAISYLQRYCTIDDLGDTIYVKKLGNNKTTFAIDFNYDEISTVRKINDSDGTKLDKIIFENNSDDMDCTVCGGLGQYDDATPCPDCGGSGLSEDLGFDEE